MPALSLSAAPGCGVIPHDVGADRYTLSVSYPCPKNRSSCFALLPHVTTPGIVVFGEFDTLRAVVSEHLLDGAAFLPAPVRALTPSVHPG